MSKSSKLPNGGYSLTQGSNYMMDGFHFDTEYGGGVLEKARLPEAKGLSTLPSGMIPLDSEGHSDIPDGLEMDIDLNIDEITKEAGQDINLVDHSWLASEPEPDLSGERSLEEVFKHLAEGRFENPQVNQLKTLQDAWGSESTTGLDIVPNENRKNRPYQNSYSDQQSQLPADDYRQKMEKLHRKLAYGDPMARVLENEQGEDILSLQSKLASEYGLHGRVYIKEEYFPGLFNGKWNEVINQKCATAMYIIPKQSDCAFDRFLGMEVVKTIPWKRVASTLLPRLETYGVKIASGSSKERVQRAFIDLIEGRVTTASSSSTWFQIQEDQSDLVSLDHARKVLGASQQEFEYIPTQEERHETKVSSKLARIAHQLVTQGFLETEVVESVVASNKTSKQKIDRLYQIASQPSESSVYQGVGKDVHAHVTKKKVIEGKVSSNRVTEGKKIASQIDHFVSIGIISKQDADQALALKGNAKYKALYRLAVDGTSAKSGEFQGQHFEAHVGKRASLPMGKVTSKETVNITQRRAKAKGQIEKVVKAGLITAKTANKIIAKHRTPEAKVKAVFDYLARPEKAQKYEGIVTSAHVLTARESLPKKTAHDAQGEKIATWLRQKISEGSAGNEVDILLASRFSQSLLDSHADRIASVRAEHEGLSGHAYVDGSAYMTNGTEGCEKGALIHRANQIPTLLKTAKCGSCVFNSGGTCQKYNKPIIASVNEIVDNPKSIQKENLRLANATDSEKTASLFVNNYDPDEFGLASNSDVDVDDETSNEVLGDVLFGGFEV